MWIQTGVTVRKRLSWVVTSVTLTFDLWPWPFAWTLPWSWVITPENIMMIRWWEHSQKGVTDRQTDRQTDRRTDGQTENTIHRAAWSQLKMQRTFSIRTYLVCCIETSWFYWKSLRKILDICCRRWIIGLITIPLQHFSDNHIDFICFGVPMQTTKLISVIWGCYTMPYEATLCILVYKQNCQWSPNIGQRCPISLQRGVKLFVQ